MPYFSPAKERPRQAKRFLTVREVEDMVAQGTREIVQEDGLVITDAAREAAHDLGVRIVKPAPQTVPREERTSTAPTAAFAAARPSATTQSPSQPAGLPPAAGTGVSASRVASAGLEPGIRGRALAPGQGDPLVTSLVNAVRANRPVLTRLTRKG